MPRKLHPPLDGRDDDVRLIATIPLRACEPGYAAEEFRVVTKRYGGEDKLDLRTFYQDKQGEWRPTPRCTSCPSLPSQPSKPPSMRCAARLSYPPPNTPARRRSLLHCRFSMPTAGA